LSLRFTFFATCAALAAPHALAQTDLQLFGMVDLAVEAAHSANGTQFRVLSGGHQSSRWGVTGAEDLGGGLSAIFRFEAGFSADDGTQSQGGRAFGREASVGLADARFGTVKLGRLPNPYFYVQNTVDAFGWSLNGGVLAVTRSQAGVSAQLLPTAVNARDDNAVGYMSPSMGGLVVRAQHALSENSPTVGSIYGLSARYVAGALDIAAGWNQQKAGSAGTGGIIAEVVGGSYNFGPAKVVAGFSQETNNCTNCVGVFVRAPGVTGTNKVKFSIANLGVRVPVGPVTTVIAQAARVADRSQYAVDPGNRDATHLAVGVEHFLSRRTMLYASIGTVGNHNGSNYALGTGTAQQSAAFPAASRATTAAAGIRHTF
jgi:predicted porin